MKRLSILMAAMLVLVPALAQAAKKAKGKKAKAVASKPGEVQRSLCGVILGSPVAEVEKKSREVTELYKKMLPDGDRMFSVQEDLEGATGCVVQVYQDRVWRVEATYPPVYTDKHPWDAMAERNTKDYGEPKKTEEKGVKTDRLKLIWNDPRTRLVGIRELRGKDSEVDVERDKVFHRIAIEDVALSMRPKK